MAAVAVVALVETGRLGAVPARARAVTSDVSAVRPLPYYETTCVLVP